MKISVIGAGAMGSLYGGKLALSGNEVVLYDINQEHVDAVNSGGLVIEELSDGSETTARPGASSDPSSVRGSDVLIVFVKSTVTEAAAKQFSSLTEDQTIVITLQNGLGNEEILRKYFGESKTAAGVTSQGATFLGPGKIRHAGNGPTHLCMSDKNNSRLMDFIDALTGAGFETHIEENIENLIWSKLIINVGINALTALTGIQNGRLLDYEEIKSVIADMVEEAVHVVDAKGITLTYSDPLQRVFEVCRKTAGNRSSMLQDFDRGSRSEIDFINMAIVKEAEKLGIPTPVNRTVGRIVKALDEIHKGDRV